MHKGSIFPSSLNMRLLILNQLIFVWAFPFNDDIWIIPVWKVRHESLKAPVKKRLAIDSAKAELTADGSDDKVIHRISKYNLVRAVPYDVLVVGKIVLDDEYDCYVFVMAVSRKDFSMTFDVDASFIWNKKTNYYLAHILCFQVGVFVGVTWSSIINNFGRDFDEKICWYSGRPKCNFDILKVPLKHSDERIIWILGVGWQKVRDLLKLCRKDVFLLFKTFQDEASFPDMDGPLIKMLKIN